VEAVRVAVGLGVAVAVVVGLGASVAAVVVPKTNIAEAVAVVGALLLPPFPFPLPVPVTDAVVVVFAPARTSCVPPAETGTVNVARNDPLPVALTEGIPVAEPSHVSCTVAWPKFDPETVTRVPAVPEAGEIVSAGAVSAACVQAGSPTRTTSTSTTRPLRNHSTRRRPKSDVLRGACGSGVGAQ
jgi:hypothetical protein